MATLSIIVCCHNSTLRLPETLNHLAAQVVPPATTWEVVLVDNASTDETAEKASAIWDRIGAPAPLRIVAEPIPGLAEARIAGLLSTQSPVVIFCDDDNWLAPNFVAKAAEIMASDSCIGAAGGRSTAVFEGGATPPPWFLGSASDFAVGAQGVRTGDASARGYLWGAGLVVRAEPLRRILSSGVRPLLSGRSGSRLLSGDDSELCKWLLTLGYHLHYDESLNFQHFIPVNRQSPTYLASIQSGFKAAHPKLSAYQAYINRRAVWTAAWAIRPTAWISLLRNEAKIALWGAQVRANVRKLRLLSRCR